MLFKSSKNTSSTFKWYRILVADFKTRSTYLGDFFKENDLNIEIKNVNKSGI